MIKEGKGETTMSNNTKINTKEQLKKIYPYETFRMKVRERMNGHFKAFTQQEIDEYFNEEQTQEFIKEAYESHSKRFLERPVRDFYRYCGIVASDLRMMW